MKIYIVVRLLDCQKQNVIVTSSKSIAEHLIKNFCFMDSYEIEEHDLMGESMMAGN